MLMFSRKGLVVSLGIGILLGILGPSVGLQCYQCYPGDEENPTNPLCENKTVKDCGDKKACNKGFFRNGFGKEVVSADCNLYDDDAHPQPECKKLGRPPTDTKYCVCSTNLCNGDELQFVDPDSITAPATASSGLLLASPWLLFGTMFFGLSQVLQRQSDN